jgi:hypothetical protein
MIQVNLYAGGDWSDARCYHSQDMQVVPRIGEAISVLLAQGGPQNARVVDITHQVVADQHYADLLVVETVA